MTCPYCNRHIRATTGLRELVKFQAHLGKCKKNPDKHYAVDENGVATFQAHRPSLSEAMKIREESNQ